MSVITPRLVRCAAGAAGTAAAGAGVVQARSPALTTQVQEDGLQLSLGGL